MQTTKTVPGLVLSVLFLLSLTYFIYGNIRAGSEPWQLLINSLLLAVPLGLLYFSIGVLATAWRQHRSEGHLSPRLAAYLYRTPRIAAILMIIFTGLFALDVFTEGPPWWEQLLAFVIHAMPSLLLAVLLVLAWRWEWVGFAAFLTCALVFLRFVIGNVQFGFGNLLLFIGPMLVIALMFLAGWQWRAEIRTSLKGRST